LRAIETRCCIARSANTGTSCFIDPMGKVTQATSWWKPTAIAGLVSLQNRQTFYVQHGDYLARLALALAALLVLYSLLKSRLRI
jgi:apolipoprotein N-acyltransferase